MIENLRVVSHDELQSALPEIEETLKTELQPILIGSPEQPSMAIMPIETYSILEAALDYLVTKEMAPDFEAWMDDNMASLRIVPFPESDAEQN